jgi:hypothetical protein
LLPFLGGSGMARPHPGLLPLGEGTAGGALGVPDELAGMASQTRSNQIKPVEELVSECHVNRGKN